MFLTKTTSMRKAIGFACRSAKRIEVSKLLLVMRLTIILLTVGFLNVHATGVSQNVHFKGRNVSLEKIFSVVKKQTGYFFFYNDVLLQDAKPVTVDADNIPLKEFMDKILSEQELEYVIENKSIIISRKATGGLNPGLLEKDFSLFLSPPPITGVVKDSTGQVLSGATVTNKRTKKSVQTNAKGEYTIDANEGDQLQISFIGYESRNMRAGSGGLILLKHSDSPLDEVQIKAYGTTTRRLSTGNITTVRAADIEKQNINNPILALQGRVPGLQITPNSGTPGAGVFIQLRGQNSLNNSNSLLSTRTQPLIIVDGIPYTNNIPSIQGLQGTEDLGMSALAFINPTDIEQIDVLKDAEATSIYGSRGANGVILITTKKGKSGTTRINASASAGVSEVSKYLDLMNTEEYLAMRKQAFLNDGLSPSDDPNAGPTYAPDLMVWDQNKYTDWQKKFLGGKGSIINGQVSVSGGNSLLQYLVSGTYRKEGYVYPGSARNESANALFSLTGTSGNQKLKFTLSNIYGATNNKPTEGNFSFLAATLPPNAPDIYTSYGALNWEPNPISGRATWENPYKDILRGYDAKTTAQNTSVEINYKLFPSTQLKLSGGFSTVKGNSFQSVPLTSSDPNDDYYQNVLGGVSYFRFNASKSWSIEPQINFSKQILNGRFDALAGFAIQRQQTNLQFVGASGYKNDAYLNALQYANFWYASNTSSDYRYLAGFGRLSYNLANKYLLSATVRRDGSSRFGPARRFGTFSSIGGAWIITEEPFSRPISSVISLMKIRGSYGSSGNDGIGDGQFQQLFQVIGGGQGSENQNRRDSILYQASQGLTSLGVYNPYYHWEHVRKLDIGLEIGFYKDRILVSATYYRNRSDDQLGGYGLPSTAGSGSFLANQPAKIQNSGVEFTVQSINVRTSHFSWSTNINLSLNRNKLISAPKDVLGMYVGYGLSTQDGDPIGKPFSGFAMVNSSQGIDPSSGIYQFLNADGEIGPWHQAANNIRLVNSPKYNGGIGNTFNYKSISLDVFFQFSKQIAPNYLFQYELPGTATNLPKLYVNNTWTSAKPEARFQKLTTAQFFGDVYEAYNKFKNSDQAFSDASFLRLKTLSLSYGFTREWLRSKGIESCRVFVQAQNLITFTKYYGPDPEIQSIFSLPQLRIATVGLQILL